MSVTRLLLACLLAATLAAAMRAGRNVIAAHCRQTYDGQFFDVGVVGVKR